jgi:hypothetical protein
MARRWPVACCIGVVASIAACSSSTNDTSVGTSLPGSGTVTTIAAPAPSATASQPPVSALRGELARTALDVVLDGLVDPSTLDAGRFTPDFLARAPLERVRSVLTSIGAGQWQATGISPHPPDELIAHLTGPGPPQVMYLAVDAEGRIANLVLQAELVDPPATFEALIARLRTAGETTAFLRADISEEGSCETVAELDADRIMPIGSVFKLYVLGGVATAIEQGRIRWDTLVTIRDDLDSLPDGITQDEPPGSQMSVRELAQRMIERSDNTATDHLIDLVGRDTVEAAVVDLGHSSSAVTVPLLTTRELFIIKSDAQLLNSYVGADEAQRRAVLSTDVAAAPLPSPEMFPTEPGSVAGVGWFASPADICRAWVGLHALASAPGLGPLGEILGANPVVVIDHNEFPMVWFKGGSEPGVSFASWLAVRPDGRVVVVAGGVADSTTNVEDDPTITQLIARGLELQ